MKKIFHDFFSAPFQLMLVISFSLVAALSITIGAWSISQTIKDYLTNTMNERVARDMQLAQAFYHLKLREIEGITVRISMDALVLENINNVINGDENSKKIIEQQIANNLPGLGIGGNEFISILDVNGNQLAGRLLSENGQQSIYGTSTRNWNSLDIIQQTISTGKNITGTEIIPSDLLSQIGLADQARITIIGTPKAASKLFDTREGAAGLALISVSPIKDQKSKVIGSVMVFHLINNDFTLVDRIRDVAGIDTVTLFLGDLRVSTNVMTQEGNRALGTRVSQEVSQVVLFQGKEFVGPAFVVNENYITRYDPLKNHAGQVIGILYVGAKQASFSRLVNTFNQRIVFFTIGTILLTIILTTPVSRTITRPLNQLKDLVEANRRVAQGDMTVRVPVTAGGEVGLLASSFNSMLDTLHTTQDHLVQSEKLASLGQLAAGVAHELNNPLGTILLYSDILLKEHDLAPSHKADLELILDETKRCKSIVSALLEFARQNQVDPKPTDINKLIENVIEMERKRYDKTTINITLQLDPNLPIIQADPAQIQEVLFNLVENAMDSMPDGGILTLQTSNKPTGMISIEVKDTGVGISPENLNKLFVPFFTTKPVGRGTGLGLAIVYGIIKMHRGQINVHSEINFGTTFTIQLPIMLKVVNRFEQNNSGLIQIK